LKFNENYYFLVLVFLTSAFHSA